MRWPLPLLCGLEDFATLLPMDDDEHDEPKKSYPLSPSKMSKASSWVMLGFLLGAASVWGLRRDAEQAVRVASAVTLKEWPTVVRTTLPALTTIEAVFAEWGQYAVWDDQVTEVALWRTEAGSFSEFYEVRRVGEGYYFRSIPQLTRRVIRHGVPRPKESPLEFTETEAHYREWFEHGRFERQPQPTVQPSLFGPALIPPGETLPRIPVPKVPAQKSTLPSPESPLDRPKIETPPKT